MVAPDARDQQHHNRLARTIVCYEVATTMARQALQRHLKVDKEIFFM